MIRPYDPKDPGGVFVCEEDVRRAGFDISRCEVSYDMKLGPKKES